MKVSVQVKVKKDVTTSRVKGIKTKTDAATHKTAEMIRDEYKSRVHRGPERQRTDGKSIYDSIEVKPAVVTAGEQSTVQVGSVNAHRGRPVARWHENGTSVTHAYPALRPAANLGRRMLKEEQEAAVRAECAKND